ncbi:MAG: TonB-dependent receptor, partial [Parafilimonas sp.]
ALQYKQPKDEITFGGSWTKYDGKHFGKIIWANIGVPDDYEYYRFCAVKTDFNVYAKWLRQINVKWNLFGDIQYRHVSHEMNGFEDNPALFIKRNFNFINPKAGISYSYNGLLAFISYALANKEPGRHDFEASIIQQPTNETLHDFEFGIERKQTKYNWAATLYYMMYRNQLVLTGKINDVGSYTRINVPNSYRAGLELQGAVAPAKWFSASGNITISTNKIKSFTEYLDNYDDDLQKTFTHSNTDISFSPSVIASAAINLYAIKNFEISLPAKYVGKQYLDNTQNELRKLDTYYSQDIRVSYKLKNVLFSESNIILQVNNVFNKKYEPNGYTYPYIYNSELINENYYYPMAGTNFMIGLNIKL